MLPASIYQFIKGQQSGGQDILQDLSSCGQVTRQLRFVGRGFHTSDLSPNEKFRRLSAKYSILTLAFHVRLYVLRHRNPIGVCRVHAT